MTRKALPGLGVALLLMIVLAPFWQGCGLDPPTGNGPPPELPTFPPENPRDVIENLQYAHNHMDYERYWPLILDGYLFIFNEDDVDRYPDIVPAEGIWGQSEELESAEHMLDPSFVPSDPTNKIDNMQLEIDFSGEPEPSNLVNDPDEPMAPPELLEGFVIFDLSLFTIGEIDYHVRSRPKFYYAHYDTSVSGADTTFYWGIWRIKDAPFQ